MIDEDELLTVRQVADIFQVSTYTIRAWIADDTIDLNALKIGGQWRVRKSEVKRFINLQRDESKGVRR